MSSERGRRRVCVPRKRQAFHRESGGDKELPELSELNDPTAAAAIESALPSSSSARLGRVLLVLARGGSCRRELQAAAAGPLVSPPPPPTHKPTPTRHHGHHRPRPLQVC